MLTDLILVCDQQLRTECNRPMALTSALRCQLDVVLSTIGEDNFTGRGASVDVPPAPAARPWLPNAGSFRPGGLLVLTSAGTLASRSFPPGNADAASRSGVPGTA
jgi:hypothetical protein